MMRTICGQLSFFCKKRAFFYSVCTLFIFSNLAVAAGLSPITNITMIEKSGENLRKSSALECKVLANYVTATPAKWSSGGVTAVSGCENTVVCQLEVTCSRQGASGAIPASFNPICSANNCAGAINGASVAKCINEYEAGKFGTTVIQKQFINISQPRFSSAPDKDAGAKQVQ